MYKEHLSYLVCPVCKSDLELIIKKECDWQVKEGVLRCKKCSKEYPIINSIARFVPQSNYADSFGYEWNMHKNTQYDDVSGINLSEKRFFEETRWEKIPKQDKVVLEAGCGGGRFTQHALRSAGENGLVISFDYSNSVDASVLRNKPSKNLLVLQASLLELPIRENIVDRCFCFGVLQFTPSSKKSIQSLVNILKVGGEFVCDHFPITKNTPFNTRYWIRPITTKIPHKTLYSFGKKYIDFMWPVFKFNRRVFSPKRANRINWRLLIPDYTSVGLSEEKLKEWAYLDFFNMLSPKYDRPIRMKTLHRYLEEAGLKNVETKPGYNGWEGRGVKK